MRGERVESKPRKKPEPGRDLIQLREPTTFCRLKGKSMAELNIDRTSNLPNYHENAEVLFPHSLEFSVDVVSRSKTENENRRRHDECKILGKRNAPFFRLTTT